MNGTDPNGNDVVAIYPMLENNLCQLLVFDFDNHAKGAEQEDYANIDDGWKEEILCGAFVRIWMWTLWWNGQGRDAVHIFGYSSRKWFLPDWREDLALRC